MPPTFDLQGHRGARGLCPENTLPSFEAALDLGVTSIETDVQLTADGVPVLCHDPDLSEALFRPVGPAAPDLGRRPPLATVTATQLRDLAADRNPAPGRFPGQRADVPPLLAEAAGVPPAALEVVEIGVSGFDAPPAEGELPLAAVQRAGLLARARVRSFDHRAVRAVRRLEPRLTTAVLIADTTPVDPVGLVRAAGADYYCPEHTCLDRPQVAEVHAAGIKVLPWTVNDPGAMRELIAWGVDGLTTDYPDRLAAVLTPH
jgi:glycerophosphoryl diester phosphodiesterase